MREKVICVIQVGDTHHRVERTLGCARIALARLMTRFHHIGRTRSMSMSDIKHMNTLNEDRYLRSFHFRNRFVTVTSSAESALVIASADG